MTKSSSLTSIGSVCNAVKRTGDIFDFDDEGGKMKTITGATWKALRGFSVTEDISKASASDKDFQVNVKDEYKGVSGGASGDVNVKRIALFKTYEKMQNRICNCRGGDTKLANRIEGSPESEVSSFQVVPLWNVMRDSNKKEVRDRADDIMKAFTWIFGDFFLLSPAAFIIAGKETPENCTITSTKVVWGKGTRNIRDAITVEVVIQNDGANVDIELCHGSDGEGRGGESQCLATFTNKDNENKGIKGNVSNAQRFYQCPVNPTETPVSY
ncbi:hypothetical protein COCSADRAFT_185608 [Bipolaris sorokiniana ND90Pr]|uniref:Uncharacterized protein n=1 Tax=Cochliobolus sativus (strain ND90Pr / ATCC 201652) TaxID=665912 RepID=M2RTN5_COCSN|nr:uncharacterized protein COCSADRAFT_185608 [Bipolaris sorokiniana ND90Pr]EMD58548.1 hypothetical protein COCSADRAFT_185608 [Bipolaris sorokiniana ND90Pr]